MDPLTNVLQDLRLKSTFYSRSELRAPWGVAFPTQVGPGFHIVLIGGCFLRLDSHTIPLQAGDLVLLPRAVDHQLVSAPDESAISVRQFPLQRIGDNAALLTNGGNGDQSLLICGAVRFTGAIAHPLLELLPPVIRLHVDSNHEEGREDGWLDSTLKLLGAEALSLRPGKAAMMTRLADILVLQMIRAWLEDDENRQRGWLSAFGDPEIGQAMALIHSRAEERWTVSSLAAEVHLSRSVFSERFSRRVGMSPIQYVTRWRMHLASNWMREDGLNVNQVAQRLGYSSAAAFSRAFKRILHILPGAVRRDA